MLLSLVLLPTLPTLLNSRLLLLALLVVTNNKVVDNNHNNKVEDNSNNKVVAKNKKTLLMSSSRCNFIPYQFYITSALSPFPSKHHTCIAALFRCV